MSEKLHKILARSGYGSRREMEAWIDAGRLSINGKKARTADRVTEADTIKLDDKLVSLNFSPSQQRTLIYNKPEGEICSRHDPEGRDTVFSHLPKLHNARWISVGRLDFNTSGLLLFTTDGELANKLMHPSAQIEREYAVRILGEVSEEIIKRLRKGVELEDGRAKFDSIVDAGGAGANHWYHVVIKEGRKREVRRLWESQELRVSRLVRIRYGDMVLPRNLRQGRWQDLEAKEMIGLYDSVNMQAPVEKFKQADPSARRHGRPFRRRRNTPHRKS